CWRPALDSAKLLITDGAALISPVSLISRPWFGSNTLLVGGSRKPGPDMLRTFSSKSCVWSRTAEKLSARCSSGLCGLNVPLRGIDLRAPVSNDQMLPSVRPAKWQLAQFCQPSDESRACLPPSNTPRGGKNTSLQTWICSSAVLGAGCAVSEIGACATVSVSRLTTATLRET